MIIIFLFVIIIFIIIIFIIKKNKQGFIPHLEYEEINNYKGGILDIDYDNKSIPITNIEENNKTYIDRYTNEIECSMNEYKYCYNGDLKFVDIFGNHIIIDDEESFKHGNSYNNYNFSYVKLEDYIEINRKEDIKGSSYYRPNVYKNNMSWVFNDKEYKTEEEASYYNDLEEYKNNNYEIKPIRPNYDKYKNILEKDIVLYKNKLWKTNISSDIINNNFEYDITNCTIDSPYRRNNTCYNKDEKLNYNCDDKNNCEMCEIISNDEVKTIKCKDLKYIGKVTNYNKYTNNFLGDLTYNMYGRFECDGLLTKCMKEENIIINDKINLDNVKVKTYDHILENNTIYNTELKKSTFIKEHYKKTMPHEFIENYNTNFISEYNDDVLPNETDFFIQCKTNNGIKSDSECPKNKPICEGNIDKLQTGVCTDLISNIKHYKNNMNYLECKKNKDCPYNLPLCKNQICTHNTVKKRINSIDTFNKNFNNTL